MEPRAATFPRQARPFAMERLKADKRNFGVFCFRRAFFYAAKPPFAAALSQQSSSAAALSSAAAALLHVVGNRGTDDANSDLIVPTHIHCPL